MNPEKVNFSLNKFLRIFLKNGGKSSATISESELRSLALNKRRIKLFQQDKLLGEKIVTTMINFPIASLKSDPEFSITFAR